MGIRISVKKREIMFLNVDFSRPVHSAFLKRTHIFSEETHQLIDAYIPFLNANSESRTLLAMACSIVHLADLGAECFNLFSGSKNWDKSKPEMQKTALAICQLALAIWYPYLELVSSQMIEFIKLVADRSIKRDTDIQSLLRIGAQACYLISLITESPTFQQFQQIIASGKGKFGLSPEQEERIFQRAPLIWHIDKISQGCKAPILLFKLLPDLRAFNFLSACYTIQALWSSFCFAYIIIHPLTNTKGINGQHDPSYNSAMIVDLFLRCTKQDLLYQSSDLFKKNTSVIQRVLPILIHTAIPTLVSLLSIHKYWETWNSKNYHIGITEKHVNINDVIGCESAKKPILKIVDQLKNPEKYTRIGPLKTLKGILFFGPPGTGKTMLAKALAQTAGSENFFQCPGSAFVDKYVGQGPSNIRALFDKASSLAEKDKNRLVVIFIDEINAIGAKRSEGDSGAGREHNNTTEAFLTSMDDSPPNVIVIGATNMEPKNLDEAFVRPGRFDEHIEFELPTKRERKAILDKLMSKYKIDPAITEKFWESIVLQSEGWSYADLTSFVEQAASEAGFQVLPHINKSVFNDTLEKVKKRKNEESLSRLLMYS